MPELEPQRYQALLKDEKTFEPQESLRILAEITQTIEAKQSLSPSNQKATRYIINKLTEIVDPMTASIPSAKETVFSLLDRLSQCLKSYPQAHQEELIESPPLDPEDRTENIRRKPESSQPIAQQPSPQEAVEKSPSKYISLN